MLQAQVTISVRSGVAEGASALEKRTGHTVKTTVAAPGEIVAVLQAGQHADVVVLTNGAPAELEDKGLVRLGRVPLATTGFGLATCSGDDAPDISTPEALRVALLGTQCGVPYWPDPADLSVTAVGGYLGYTGRNANVAAKAAPDPFLPWPSPATTTA